MHFPKRVPRRAVLILALNLSLCALVVAVAACGANPTATPAPTATPLPSTDTPVPPTATPVPPTATPVPPTDTPAPAGPALAAEPFRHGTAGYQIRYPEGWLHYAEPQMEGDIFYAGGEEIESVVWEGTVPNEPIVLVLAGPLDTAYYGMLAETRTAEEALEGMTASVADGEAERSEVVSRPLAGETAAVQELRFLHEDTPMVSYYAVLHLGDRVLAVLAAGAEEDWADFVPTLEAMLDTLEILEPQAVPAEALVLETARYAVTLPAGWQYLDVGGGNVILYASDEVASELMGGQIPSVPIIWIASGPLASMADGELAGAADAFEMAELIAEARAGEGENYQRSETMETHVDDTEAATAGFSWVEEGTGIVGNAVTIHLGDWGIAVQAAGKEENWDAFLPDYIAVLDSLVLLDTPVLDVDFADPAAVLQAVFTAAQTGDPTALPYLCDPLGESDGDVAMICTLDAAHDDWEGFVAYFAPGQITGEPVVDGDTAAIDFAFGPDGDQAETMTLVRRDGKWFLRGY